MANQENLKRFSSSEAAENGRKGAAASAEARRRKKHAKEILKALSTQDVRAKDVSGNWDEMTAYDAVCAAMMRKAISGDVKAATFVVDLIGDSLNAEKLKLETKKFKAERADAARANTTEPVEVVLSDDIKELSE